MSIALICLLVTVTDREIAQAHCIYEIEMCLTAVIIILPTFIAILYTMYCIFYPYFKKYWENFFIVKLKTWRAW